MADVAIRIKVERCKHCGSCVTTCSEQIFLQAEPRSVPEARDVNRCIACGHCVAACPADAIEHSGFPPGSFGPLTPELLPSSAQVFEMLRTRRSNREFLDKPVPTAVVEQVLEAARTAPSAHNYQKTQYVIVQGTETRKRLFDLLAGFYAGLARQVNNPLVRAAYRLQLSKTELAGVVRLRSDFDMIAEHVRQGEDPFLHRAPCIIIAHAERDLNFPESNAAIALHNATLMAQALGLGGFLIGYLVAACGRDRRFAKLLDLPPTHRVYGALALGYPKRAYTRWLGRKALATKWM
jgi:nitroreductase/NAD-dependent dihydropyrimidine dehydrogenase PreA subunit